MARRSASSLGTPRSRRPRSCAGSSSASERAGVVVTSPRMVVERLENSRWGFGSSCFVCEPANDRGMQVPFSHDTDRGVVFADFTLGPEFSGAPTYVHGGATLALMDEGMSWATI